MPYQMHEVTVFRHHPGASLRRCAIYLTILGIPQAQITDGNRLNVKVIRKP